MRKLCVSFTGLLYALKSGRVSEGDLEDALFAFACARGHAFDPGVQGEESNEVKWAFGDDPAAGERVHAAIVSALLKAEREGRVVWRELREGNMSFRRLNWLLRANGYQRIRTRREPYGYPTVEKLVGEQRIPLEVIWRS